MNKNAKPTTTVMVMNGELELTIQATNESFFRKLMIEMGDPEMLIDASRMQSLQGEKKAQSLQAADKLLDYCLGWGVVDDPPPTIDFNELQFVLPASVANNLNNPYMRRSYWLRYFINGSEGLTQDDLSTLVAEIGVLTLNQPMQASNGTNPTKKKKKKKK